MHGIIIQSTPHDSVFTIIHNEAWLGITPVNVINNLATLIYIKFSVCNKFQEQQHLPLYKFPRTEVIRNHEKMKIECLGGKKKRPCALLQKEVVGPNRKSLFINAHFKMGEKCWFHSCVLDFNS